MARGVLQGGQHGDSAGLRRTSLLFGGLLAGLLTLNALYFLTSHTRVEAQLSQAAACLQHSLQSGSGDAPAKAALTAAPASDADAATLAWLREDVLKDREAAVLRPPMESWLREPAGSNTTLAEQRAKVAAYLRSSEFKSRVASLQAQTSNERGIVISAGGKYYLPQAIVLLRVLRRNLHSRLPVEIFWLGDKEMDGVTLQALKAEFGPLEGYDAAKLPYPAHHLAGAKLKGFPMKPFALLNSRFKQALLWDCDVVPLRDPAYVFDSPGFAAAGNWFWGDIYGSGMFKDEAYDVLGLDRRVKAVLDAGKADFNRYAESGQLMIDRARHLDVLEWVWFINSFSEGGIYDLMYGDKDTYALGFALAGKAHLYQHINVPPGGLFTSLARLGWRPGEKQMNKQGNWWLQALTHYDPWGELLHSHRVTGELHLGGAAPFDEVITPPLPHSWSMWFMGYGPSDSVQTSLNVVPLNVTYLLATSPPGQACPLAAWSAYWTLRTHGIPIERNLTLEARCAAALDAQYGAAGGVAIRASSLLEHPLRLVVNGAWDAQVDGGWHAPRAPLLAVPLNMSAAHAMWRHMDDALAWLNAWAKDKPTLQRHLRRARRRRRLGR